MQFVEQGDQLIETEEIAIFVRATGPGGGMTRLDARGERTGLAEVDHPHGGFVFVVHEEKGRADDLVRVKEVRTKALGTKGQQTIEILSLESNEELREEVWPREDSPLGRENRRGILGIVSEHRSVPSFVGILWTSTHSISTVERRAALSLSPWEVSRVPYFDRFDPKAQLLTGTESLSPDHVAWLEDFLFAVLGLGRRVGIEGEHFLVQILEGGRSSLGAGSLGLTARGSGSRSDVSRSSSRYVRTPSLQSMMHG